MNLFDSHLEELLARGGTYDITGTAAVTGKQYWGFNASEGAVIAVIKGIPLKSTASTLAAITSDEVDISAIITNDLTSGRFGGVIYRADGYIITNVTMTSGSLHCYMMKKQISA